jgi:hypothetical protein
MSKTYVRVFSQVHIKQNVSALMKVLREIEKMFKGIK